MFHHALKIIEEVCIGCSRCMNSCPTDALRIRNGKAKLISDRCIDCGKCYRVCPVNAIIVDHDDFKKIFNFKYRVALIPAILTAQFDEEFEIEQIYSAIRELGFTHVYEVEHASVLLPDFISEYSKKTEERPLISSYCPAIVRMIQVKFPSLIDNIVRVTTPVDISSIYFRKLLEDSGAESKEVGLFYITPCAAKIASVKSPVGEKRSNVDGVITLDFIYNRIFSILHNKDMKLYPFKDHQEFNPEEISWSLTGGEAKNIKTKRSLSIDGVSNVFRFLEQVESRELQGVDYLELRACDESCAGGILTVENRFIAADRLRKRSKSFHKGDGKKSDIFNHKSYLRKRSSVGKITPRSVDVLDEDFYQAMLKMQKLKEYEETLPGVDCGVCGSPNCKALARDIIDGKATLSYCVFLHHKMVEEESSTTKNMGKLLRSIWGNKKFE
ncbi:MAG: ferredoxin [Candidatus Delongbacteria bacterium]|nr:MAG: ferredoxin [Candidatus Delongbacteria bacterium]